MRRDKEQSAELDQEQLDNEFREVDLQKEEIKKMPLSVRALRSCLVKAFKALDLIRGHETILAVGNTGCGKSTMLTSLVFGPDSLELQNCEKKIDVKKGGKVVRQKTITTQVIEQKNKEAINTYHIGHSNSRS